MNRFFPLLFLALFVFSLQACSQQHDSDPWTKLDSIRALIVAPTFANKAYLITDYGAKGDGVFMNTAIINDLITRCSENGGGKVVVPKGVFLSGAIHLKSNVNLHFEDGSKIIFSRNPQDYLPMVRSRWEGMDLMNYSPLIYAYQVENIAITGNGILDGNADNAHWWPWKAKKEYGWVDGMDSQLASVKQLTQQVKDRVPVEQRIYGEGGFLRPPFIQPYQSKNIVIADVTINNAPFWNLNPVLCENVIVRDVKIITHGPNNDGCDPEASKNVLITGCYFDTGDDCIAIKSGRNEDGRDVAVPAENIIIENCIMKDGHGGIVIGSEISGGAKNIFAQNLQMDSPELDRVIRLKTSSLRGGTIDGLYVRNIKVGTYKEAAIRFNMFYENPGDHLPQIKNVWIENLQVEKGGKFGVLIDAYKESPITNFTVINSSINGVDVPIQSNYTENVVFSNFKINGKIIESIESANNNKKEKSEKF
ncbi:glycoside hydrolase family 28 protein [Sphingobacterium olei]|uniref:Glycoside hydrolase family 28 protein n=1 Tax=Sphingobacterium olei TaxID=2571155 RepID=A0A4U0P388_9SPHI|nr:glycoside hydrolase family 28 protein [Sphingobacterium olei]TJZ61811.1 glycoside hydrolase family 28 protein [Sphingobacterium olei]